MFEVLTFFFAFPVINALSNLSENRKKQINFQLIFSMLVLIVFFAFRDLPVLNDTAHYYGHLTSLLKRGSIDNHSIFFYPTHERFEYGFNVLERFIAKYIWHDAFSIIFFTSIIISVFIVFYIRRYAPTKIALTCFLLFTFLITINSGIRQAYAVMLFLLAFNELSGKHYLRYYILVGIACLFHTSALVLLFFPLLGLIKFRARNIFLVILGSLVVAAVINPILVVLNFDDSVYYMTNMRRETLPLAAIIECIWSVFLACCIWYITINYNVRSATKWFGWSTVVVITWRIVGIAFLIFRRFALYWDALMIIYLVYCITQAKQNETSRISLSGYTRISTNQIWFIICLSFTIKFILTLVLKNEWFHLIPYGFYDFKPGYHDYNFGY